MKRALELVPKYQGLAPSATVVSFMLNWLGANEDDKEVEDFLKVTNVVPPMDQEMYHILLKANFINGIEVDRF